MNIRLSPDHPAAESSHAAEPALPAQQGRRDTPWIAMPFLATVRCVDRDGERFEADTVLDNLSTHGLAMQLVRPVEPGTRILIVVRFSIDPAREGSVPGVVAHGVVQQVELRPDGAYGVVVAFTHHRFLYASTTDR